MGRFTDKEMQASAGNADQWLTDTFGKGAGALLGRITPSGARTFYFRYTGSKGQVRLPIGPYHSKGDGTETFTVAQARAKAMQWSVMRRDQGIVDLREHLAQVKADIHRAADMERQRLAEEQRRQQEAVQAAQLERERRISVRQLFERWAVTELKPRDRADGRRTGRKDGGQYTREQFERHVFPRIGEMAATDVRKSDLLALLDVQTAAGKLRTANVLLADLKQMFRFALARELIERNPLDTVVKRDVGGANADRERVLTEDEIRLLASSTPRAGLMTRSACAIWLTLATGVRVGELMGAIWADALPPDPIAAKAKLDTLQALAETEGVKLGVVDIAARSWYLPTTKNQRDHTIHLSDFALEQIAKLYGLREVMRDSSDDTLSPWVFPATDNRRPVCIKSFGKQLADRQRRPEQRMMNRTKATTALMLPGGKWTAHDLRRTAGTLMARLGFSSDTINECLNHVTTDRMARVYIRDRREADQARAFDALGTKLAELSTGATAVSNVVPIGRAA